MNPMIRKGFKFKTLGKVLGPQPMFKWMAIFLLAALNSNCNNGDGGIPPEPTLQELVTTTGRWYIDFIENEVMDDCYKTSYFEFDGDIITEQWFYTDDTDDCAPGFSETNAIEWTNDTTFRVLDDDYPYDISIKTITETQIEADLYSVVNEEISEIILDKNPGED